MIIYIIWRNDRETADSIVLVFDGGSEISFTLRSEREGEHALCVLEHAQSLLEELTYSPDLEKALANDAFFDVRVDDSWGSVAPSGPVSGATRRRRALLHGSLATASALLLGGALGWAAFVSRNWASLARRSAMSLFSSPASSRGPSVALLEPPPLPFTSVT